MSVVFRARAHQHDLAANKTRLATFYYDLGEIGPLALTPAQFSIVQLAFLQVIHNTLGFAMRGIMSPQQGILRWSSVYWEDTDTVVVPDSYAIYNVPDGERYGVFDESGLVNIGSAPTASFTTRFSSLSGTSGTVPSRAGNVQVLSAPESVGLEPPLFIHNTELSAVASAILSPVDVDGIPLIAFPLTTAYPVRAKVSYDDEILSSDPDATANDYLAGFARLTSCNHSLVPRYRDNHLKAFAGL